ncbi:alkaline phosphatase [Aliidiomarina minuta]|uniref:Alkaline phosphatase n=1 Tax=Aliidiomarina minuta TaxID=880057 RepID=A0A432W741_9GAMM|nr:DUF3413 domain-containing protein [Aliidiomarina minuta]RUO25888.1 alkaline phosphatase [Aliidiomarina minuta]
MGKHQKRDRIARLISWGHWFTFSNIVLCLVIGLLYIETADATGSLLGNLYLFINWIGHFAFLPFVFFIILLFPFCLILPYSRVLRGLGALVASFGIFILLFDAFFFRQYGFHLNTYSLAQMARDAETLFAGASFVGLLGVIFGFLLILMLQVTLANLTWKRLDNIRDNHTGGAITAILVSCFLASHMIHIWADATLYTPITQQDDLLPLSYPTTAKSLMARHGWITPETYQSQRDRLTDGEQLRLRYPLSSLLCAKQPQARSTLIVAFDQLTPAQQIQMNNQVAGIQPLARQSISHSDVEAAAFQLVYSLPDLYQQQVKQAEIAPAYQETMHNFGHQIHFYHSLQWPIDQAPSAIQSQLVLWPEQSPASPHMTVIFATQGDFEAMLTAIRAAQLNNQRILITALTPAADLTEEQSDFPVISQQFTVPMWSANIEMPEHEFSHINDIMPTALSGFMSCAEDFDTFTSGRDLTREVGRLPRVQSINSRIFIFEQQQITLLDRNGEMAVYSTEGELKPGATPPTPVLIQSLQELQRFSAPNN